MVEDLEWTTMVIHSVPTIPFKGDEGAALIRSELETFNPSLTLMRNPIWLSNEETRASKLHSSMLIHIGDPKIAKELTYSKQLILAGAYCKVTIYIPKHIQCPRCQGYGHTKAYCTRDIKCRVCSLGHTSQTYTCTVCQTTNQICPHHIAKCANCGQGHMADSKQCSAWTLVKPRLYKPRPRPRSRGGSNPSHDLIDIA
jgi:hypothetical protein